jgi:hypothetical protein
MTNIDTPRITSALLRLLAEPKVLLGLCLVRLKQIISATLHILPYHWWFTAVFVLRYIRVVGTIVGSIRYRPTPIPSNPKHQASDVTVVIPTTEILSETFRDVVHSILRHPVHKLIIATAGTEALTYVIWKENEGLS